MATSVRATCHRGRRFEGSTPPPTEDRMVARLPVLASGTVDPSFGADWVITGMGRACASLRMTLWGWARGSAQANPPDRGRAVGRDWAHECSLSDSGPSRASLRMTPWWDAEVLVALSVTG